MSLTDNAVIVAWFNVGNPDSDCAKQDTEIARQRI